MREKCVQEGEEVERLRPQLEVLIAKTRELQSQVSVELILN